MTSSEKVYAMMLESENVNFLSLQYAKSLEEAFMQARIEYSKLNGGDSLAGAKIGLFTIKTVKDLTSESMDFNKMRQGAPTAAQHVGTPPVVPKRPPGVGVTQVIKIQLPKKKTKLTKNELMKKIVEAKDHDLFNKNIRKFTKEEREYLRSQLDK